MRFVYTGNMINFVGMFMRFVYAGDMINFVGMFMRSEQLSGANCVQDCVKGIFLQNQTIWTVLGSSKYI